MSRNTNEEMMTIAPRPDCPDCPRLWEFREQNQQHSPHYFNGAVPAFGALDAPFLIVGLAPGLKGANATGRPFTGDFAGDILYAALKQENFASGDYRKRADDGFALNGVRITNAVRCVPPQNKPTPAEIRQCNSYLQSEIAAMPKLKLILTLGTISHQAVMRALGEKPSAHHFAHGALHQTRRYLVLNSYHTSRYNIQTKRLTEAMFAEILAKARAVL